MQRISKMLVLCMMLMAGTSFAETPIGADQPNQKKVYKVNKLAEIEKGIIYLLRCCPAHPVVREPDLRMKVAQAIYDAAEKTDYDWEVLASMTYAESSFYMDAKGPIGEVGLMQLHTERPWKHCMFKEGREVDKENFRDQIICGAHWLRFGQERVCNGTVKQAVAKFMTRSTCVPDPDTDLAWKVNRRMRIMKVLGSDKVQVEFEKIWEENKERRAQYLAEKKAKRQAKLQAKWDRRWKKRQEAKRARKAALQAKWDAQYRKRQTKKKEKEQKGIVFSAKTNTGPKSKG